MVVINIEIDKEVIKIVSEKRNMYIEKSKEKDKTKIITDERVFSSNYIPNKIFHRDNQISQIADHFIPTQFQKYCPDLSIFGVSGTGKSLVTRMVFSTLAKDTDDTFYVYIPCNEYNTASILTKHIINQISTDVKCNGKGTNENIKTIKELIKNKLLVLIFDEVDSFLGKDQQNENIIRIFSDWVDVCLIFISNDAEWHSYISDSRTISRLHLTTMFFDPYISDELFDILKDRAVLGLATNSITDELLYEIANFTSQYTGDSRAAIKILIQAAKHAENRLLTEIDESCIQFAINSIESDTKISFAQKLPPQQKIILIAVYLSQKFGKPTFEKVYNQYEKLIENSISFKKLTRNTIRKYIDELATYHLILKKHGRGLGQGKGKEPSSFYTNFDVEKFEKEILSTIKN